MNDEPELVPLIQAVVQGEAQKAVELAKALLERGYAVQKLICKGLTAALRSLDSKCTNEEFNLLEIMLAGRAMMAVMDNVVAHYTHKPCLTGPDPGKTIIIGTIKGDIHELGKHVVKMVLKAEGFRVIDVGKDISPADFVKAAMLEGAGYIGVSSLITLTIPHIREIREVLYKEGLGDIKVIAGGAALQQTCAADLNVDFVARDAFDVLRYIGNKGPS
jgi:methylmalonyl-CoA mutase cobalamin-binding domain/chain